MASSYSVDGIGLPVPEQEIEWTAIRASGAGGQNVNKVSSAVHLRFDIRASSLPDAQKARLLAKPDHRITQSGVVVIKAQRFRTREKNRLDALQRLQELLQKATVVPKVRRPTRPSKGAKKRRMDQKSQRGQRKKLRGKVEL